MSLLQNGLNELIFPAPSGWRGLVRRRRPGVDDADDLIDGEGDDAEDQIAFGLERAPDAEKPAAELVFQPSVDVFGHGAEILDYVVEVGHVDQLHVLDLAAPSALAS